jgi:hypothetical protein
MKKMKTTKKEEKQKNTLNKKASPPPASQDLITCGQLIISTRRYHFLLKSTASKRHILSRQSH